MWKHSDLFVELRQPQSAGACASCGSYDACQGGCMAAKFFTGLPLDGPDPECVNGFGRGFGSLISVFTRQGGDGLTKSKNQRDREDQINEQTQRQNKVSQPAAVGPREEDERQQPVEHDDDQDKRKRGFEA